MRGQGRVFRPRVKGRQTSVWWLDYSVGGRRHRESTHLTGKSDALELLRQRIGDRRSGKLVGHPDRVTLHAVRELAERQYTLDGRRSLVRCKQAWEHMEKFFGVEARIVGLTPVRRDAYAEHRLAEGVARSTVNYELAVLRRGERLGVEKGLLATSLSYKLPQVRNARAGFFEEGDFAALLVELADDVRPIIRFLRLTGWRKNEALGLTWDQVDWDGEVIRLNSSQTKGGDARVFPFGLAPELKDLLKTQWEARDGLFVFHRSGKPVRTFRTAWKAACKRAGLEGMLVHDLRRTAARDFRRQGVSEGEIMKLCGWKTRAMFDRYNIIDEADLAQAVAKRFSGKQAANTTTPTTPPGPLSSSPA